MKISPQFLVLAAAPAIVGCASTLGVASSTPSEFQEQSPEQVPTQLAEPLVDPIQNSDDLIYEADLSNRIDTAIEDISADDLDPPVRPGYSTGYEGDLSGADGPTDLATDLGLAAESDLDDVEFRESDDDDYDEQLTGMIGARDYFEDFVSDRIDGGFALGIEYAAELDREFATGQLGYELGILGSLGSSSEEGTNNISGAFVEFYGGGRWTFDIGERWHPYVGAGLALVLGGVDVTDDDQASDAIDFSPGIYAHGGVVYDIDETYYIGVDIRVLGATSNSFDGVRSNTNYAQGLLVFGGRF